MQRVLGRIVDGLRSRFSVARRADVLFYAASWVDEAWVRSTIGECRRRDWSCILAVRTAVPGEDRRRYEAMRVAVEEGADADTMARLAAPIAVTASSGVSRSLFGRAVKTLAHMPHSIVSLHMIYPESAFDGYDVMFAAGPHHAAEFSALTAARHLGPRRSFAVGYGKADLLLENSRKQDAERAFANSVLLAPSWGPHSLLPTMGLSLVEALIESGKHVVLRPHPLHVLEKEPAYEAIVAKYSDSPGFSLEFPDAGSNAMQSAEVLVTDYSGTAFEFALLGHRPVVFVDVPKKIVNGNWEEVGLAPIEVALREKIGVVVSPNPAAVADAVTDLARKAEQWRERIASALPMFLYHRENCAAAAADAIGVLMDGTRPAGGARRAKSQ